MTQYPKMQSLYMREDKGNKKGNLLLGQFVNDEVQIIKFWTVTEKMDGTNIRIIIDAINKDIQIKGRTDRSNLPSFIMDYLTNLVDSRASGLFADFEGKEVVLYGECIGNKINKNIYKLEGQDFILFDVKVNGMWLKIENMNEIAVKHSFKYIEILGHVFNSQDAVEYVEKDVQSKYSDKAIIEGVVCRSSPTMLYRNGDPIYFKLKRKDFRRLQLQQ